MKSYVFLRNSAVAVLALVSSAGIGFAQGQKGNFDPEAMAEKRVAAMKERLKLTDDQVPKVKAIILESAKKQREIMQKYGPPQQGQPMSEDARNELTKSREDSNKKMAEVLTQDQMAEYQKMMAEMGGRGRRQKQQQQ
jgi:CHASE3 domain sensor protein